MLDQLRNFKFNMEKEMTVLKKYQAITVENTNKTQVELQKEVEIV